MDIANYYCSEFTEHQRTVEATREAMAQPFLRLVTIASAALRSGGKLMFFGNGGSAADSQHIATELTIRYQKDRPAIAAIALTTDTSALTAAGNDLGFESLFSRQIEALARPEDVAIGISTSGNSVNIIRALQAARRIGATAAAFSGKDGGLVRSEADPVLIVPSKVTSRIQEMHIVIGHMLCGAIERELGYVVE